MENENINIVQSLERLSDFNSKLNELIKMSCNLKGNLSGSNSSDDILSKDGQTKEQKRVSLPEAFNNMITEMDSKIEYIARNTQDSITIIG